MWLIYLGSTNSEKLMQKRREKFKRQSVPPSNPTLAMAQGETCRGSNLQRWTRLWSQKPAFTSAMPWALWIILMMQVKGMPVSSVP